MLLNCHTFFSLRYGTVSDAVFIALAKELGYEKIALTDINNTSAFFQAHQLGMREGVAVVAGIDIRNGIQQQYILLAEHPIGWTAMNQFLSQYLHAGQPFPNRAPQMPHVFVVYPFQRDWFFELHANEYIGLRPQDLPMLQQSTWKHHPEKLVALNTATFRNKRDFNTHRLLRAIANNCLLSKLSSSEQARPTDAYFSPAQLQQLFEGYTHLLDNAAVLLQRCHFDYSYKQSQNKKTFTQSAEEDARLLEALARNGLQYRYSRMTDEISERLSRELDLIKKKDFVTYFLISWDIVRYARQRGYFYVGRGSGANSLIAYCLGITDVDPIELDLYFERFINLYRDSPPDFDMDFSWKDREDVTRYIFEKHGLTHTALLGAYNTFQFRATVRELGKVFGLPKEDIDLLVSRAENPENTDEIGQLILKYSTYIQGFPNYVSIHAGGILIAEKPIHQYSATFMPPKGFPTVFFDMHIAEDIGLYKFDILSQRGLGHIRDAVEYVRENQGKDIDIHDIPRFKRDKKIKRLMTTGHTIGCFYVESPAMRQLLRKLNCTDYISLVAASSIIRPGVARSGMMQEFIKRYRFPEARQKAHPVLLDILPETFGVMVYQEDVIKVAHYFAGLTLAEADVLRRGMSGKSRSKEEFQRVRDAFFTNCAEKGYSEQLAKEVWFQIESFAGYSFSKAHSASYAVESFQSLYLKAHFPLEFMCAVINNFGGFYKTEFYVNEARLNGAEVIAPCVNNSETLCRISGKRIYIGLAFIESLEQAFVYQLLKERKQHGLFQDLEDFVQRMQPSLTQLKTLIKSGGFTFTGITKKELFWRAHLQAETTPTSHVEQGALFKPVVAPFNFPNFNADILEEAYDQIALLGFPLVSPFLLCDTIWQPHLKAAELSDHMGKEVRLYGYLVTIKPTKTVKGERMCFGTFVDADGNWIDTTHFPKIASAFPFRGRGIYEIIGVVDAAYGVYSINVTRMQRLPDKQDPRGEE